MRQVIIIFLLILLNSTFIVKASNEDVIWSNKVKNSDKFVWIVKSSNYINEEEKWNLVKGLGARQDKGTIIEIKIGTNLPTDFYLNTEKKLELTVILDRHLVLIPDDVYNSDYELAILPILYNNQNFFETLFNNTELLENLTKAEYVESLVTNNKASLRMNMNETYDIFYEWDTSTGLLDKKSVVDNNGTTKIVIKHRKPLINNLYFWISFPLVSLLIITTKRKRENN